MTTRILHLGVAMLLLSASTAALPVPVAADASPPVVHARAGQSDGFGVESRTLFGFVPDSQTVQVAMRATITNETPPVVGPRIITETFLPEFGFPVLTGATNFVASADGGGELRVRTEVSDVPDLTFAVIDLVPDLTFPNSVTVNLTYEIPATGPRSDSLARINPAFATFPVFATGDSGRTSIEVTVPDGFEIEMVGDQLFPRSEDDTSVYVAENIEFPGLFTSFVVLSDTDRLGTQTVAAGEQSIDVRAWPDDPQWAAFVSDHIIEGIPALEEAIGLPWPADDTFEIIETLSPYLYGYAGWYTPYESSIEIGDELDPDVILHELAHLWFNQQLVQGRWLNEALAEEFASIARERTEGVATDPDPIDRTSPGVLQLNDWDDPVFQSEVTEAQERYGYQASWWVIDQISDEIGDDALGEVVRAASDRTIPYLGDPDGESIGSAPDWRRVLDLLEEVGGSEGATDLFSEHVVDDDGRADLLIRAATRTEYEALVDAGDGWTPPLDLRSQMTYWSFAEATSMIEDSHDLLDIRDGITDDAPDLDLDALEAEYETSDDFDELVDTFDAADDAAVALVAADDSVESTFAPVGFVADIGHGPSDDLDAARAAFADGDFEGSAELANQAAVAADRAWITAFSRIAVVIALIGGPLLVLWAVRRRPHVAPHAC